MHKDQGVDSRRFSSDEAQPEVGLPNIENLLALNKPEFDDREVRNIQDAQRFIKSLNLNEHSTVATIGPGRLSGFFWPKVPKDCDFFNGPIAPRPGAQHVWERLLTDTGAHMHVFEPSLKMATGWSAVKRIYGLKNMTVHFFEDAFFQNASLGRASVDAIVFMNLFGTPMLLLDPDESMKIVEKMATVLKDGGTVINGDNWPKDAVVTQRLLEPLLSNSKLQKVYSYTKGGQPWQAYRYQR